MHSRSFSAIIDVLVIGLLFLSGCADGPSRESDSFSPVVFEQPSVNLGHSVGPSLLSHDFQFQVTSKDGVVVSAISSSCGCITPDNSVVGEPLVFGEKHVIRVEIQSDDKGGLLKGKVFVKTDPPSSKPIILSLRGTVTGLPYLVGINPIHVESAVGETAAVRIQIVRIRSRKENTASLDVPQSDFGRYEFLKHQVTLDRHERSGAQAEDGIRELHVIDLRGSALHETGKRSDHLEIAWNGESLHTTVDVVRRVTHPFELEIARPFLGFLKPCERWECDYSFARGNIDLKHLEIQVPEGGDLDARCDFDTRRLAVSVIAPRSPGRFEKQLVLRSSTDDIAPLRVVFSGIVE